MKKICLLIIVVTLSFTACKTSTKNSYSFNYQGINWDKYENYSVDIVVLDTTIERTHSVLDKRVVIKNGAFQITDTLEQVRNAYITLYDTNGEYKYKQGFILEPGHLEFNMKDGESKSYITGGKYNDLILNTLKDNAEYQSEKEKLSNFSKTLTQESYQIDSIRKKYSNLSGAVRKLEKQHYTSIFNGTDKYAQLLIFNKMGFSEELKPKLEELAKVFGNDHPEIYTLRQTYKSIKERANMLSTVGIGSSIKDFVSEDLNGKEFKLSNVLKKNKYVLVEFWASWCGPCRAEIPHMKRAYKANHEKGFEIVSFTLDNKKEKWEKASREEQLPWINVGDLKAHKSPVVKMYGVSGIPANFLVDKTGTIIAKNLRQEKLDEKLHELLK